MRSRTSLLRQQEPPEISFCHLGACFGFGVFFVLKPLKYKVKLEAMVSQLTCHSGKVAAANSRGEGVCARAGTQGRSLSSSVRGGSGHPGSSQDEFFFLRSCGAQCCPDCADAVKKPGTGACKTLEAPGVGLKLWDYW